MKLRFEFISILVVSILASSLIAPAKAAEETTVSAFATWQSAGRLFLTGEQEALFVGGLNGLMFIEKGDGALNTAKIVCPATMVIRLTDGYMTGEGRCIMTGTQGNRVFGKWGCIGIALKGCKGIFELTAGTGRFRGISGGGTIILRTAIAEFVRKSTEKDAKGIGLGLIVWPKLTYKLP